MIFKDKKGIFYNIIVKKIKIDKKEIMKYKMLIYYNSNLCINNN